MYILQISMDNIIFTKQFKIKYYKRKYICDNYNLRNNKVQCVIEKKIYKLLNCSISTTLRVALFI